MRVWGRDTRCGGDDDSVAAVGMVNVCGRALSSDLLLQILSEHSFRIVNHLW